MKRGDRVRVYLHGKPEEALIAKVDGISDRQIVVAVSFEDRSPEDRMMLFAYRLEIDGKPWGPWIGIPDSSHYEIEEL